MIINNLFDPDIVAGAIDRYMNKTDDYSILDRFDAVEFSPTFRIATNTIEIFSIHDKPTLSFRLKDVIGTNSLADILNTFQKNNINNGHVFQTRNDTGSMLTVYYISAFKYFPKSHLNILCSWKRSGIDETLPGRKHIWNIIWEKELKHYFVYHPAIFLAMNRYIGPIPAFLQQLTDFMTTKMHPMTMTNLYDTIVNQPWRLPVTFTPLFIDLWHQVMQECAMAYIPNNTENNNISSISFQQLKCVYMCSSDKLLCLLLILFNKPYRTRLNKILLHEPTPPVLANIFTHFPTLQYNEC